MLEPSNRSANSPDLINMRTASPLIGRRRQAEDKNKIKAIINAVRKDNQIVRAFTGAIEPSPALIFSVAQATKLMAMSPTKVQRTRSRNVERVGCIDTRIECMSSIEKKRLKEEEAINDINETVALNVWSKQTQNNSKLNE
jgi:hypothetical protein